MCVCIYNKQSTMYYSYCINCLFLITFQFCVFFPLNSMGFSQNSLKNPQKSYILKILKKVKISSI